MATATTAPAWTDHYFTASDGTKLHYAEMGEGTPASLIHGAGGSAVGNWFRNGIAPALAPTNRVIGIDMRRHGLSEAGPEGSRANMPKRRRGVHGRPGHQEGPQPTNLRQ